MFRYFKNSPVPLPKIAWREWANFEKRQSPTKLTVPMSVLTRWAGYGFTAAPAPATLMGPDAVPPPREPRPDAPAPSTADAQGGSINRDADKFSDLVPISASESRIRSENVSDPGEIRVLPALARIARRASTCVQAAQRCDRRQGSSLQDPDQAAQGRYGPTRRDWLIQICL